MALDNLVEHWSIKPGKLITNLGLKYELKHTHKNEELSATICSEAQELKHKFMEAIVDNKISIKNNPTLNVTTVNQEENNLYLTTNIIKYVDYMISAYVYGRIFGSHKNNEMAPLGTVVTVCEDKTIMIPIELAKINTSEGAGKISILGGAVSNLIGIDPKLTVYDVLKKKLGIPKEEVKELYLAGASIDRTDNYLELSYIAHVSEGSIQLPIERKKSVQMLHPEDILSLLKDINSWKASVFYSISCALAQKEFFGPEKIRTVIENSEKKLYSQLYNHTFSIEYLRQNGVAI